MSNKPELAMVLAMLAAAYPRFKLTKETTEVYSQLLSDVPIETLKAAALHCATTCDFFPSVHELRQGVAEIQRRAHNVPSAYEAWQDLKKAGPGYWKKAVEIDGKFYIEEHVYQFIHPIVKQVAEMLGWPSEFPGDNPMADRAHFFKAYDQTVADLMERENMLPELAGYIEKQRKELSGGNSKPKQLSTVIKDSL